jgi:hypothetical protein
MVLGAVRTRNTTKTVTIVFPVSLFFLITQEQLFIMDDNENGIVKLVSRKLAEANWRAAIILEGEQRRCVNS